MTKSTVYVENFPPQLTNMQLAMIFARAGKVMHVSIPKFKASKQSKGFAFIEYSKEEEANEAIKKFDNCVPVEFVDMQHPNYIQVND